MVDPATLVISGISALSAVIQAYKAALDIGKDMSEEDMEKVFKDTTPAKSASTALNTLIDEEILSDLVENINESKSRLREVLRDSESKPSQKRRKMDEIDKDVCFQLETIKRYNGNIFPDLDGLDFYELAERHRCTC